jgi:hypothetical protein
VTVTEHPKKLPQGYTGLLGELEHLKIKTRLINENFTNVMGECDLDVMGSPSKLSVIRKTVRKDVDHT